MVRTWNDGFAATVTAETCPVCRSLRVHALEPDWFAIEIDRRDELRGAEAPLQVEFACTDCGTRWK